MTKIRKCDILGYSKKTGRESALCRKEKAMTAMNRFDQLYSECKPLALPTDREWSFDFAYSFKAWHERGNCVFDIAWIPEN